MKVTCCKITYQSKADHPPVCISLRPYDLDLDLDPVTLLLNIDLDILNIHIQVSKVVPCSITSVGLGAGAGFLAVPPQGRDKVIATEGVT